MHLNFIDKNYSEEDISVYEDQILKLYIACYSQAKDLKSLENIFKNNPKQLPELGPVIDFTVGSKQPPYATLPEIREHLAEYTLFLVHTFKEQDKALIHYKNGNYYLGKVME